MPASAELVTVNIGSPSRDYYKPIGDVRLDHQPGAKIDLPDSELVVFDVLRAKGIKGLWGGNGYNSNASDAAYLLPNEITRFVTVLGDDVDSHDVVEHLVFMGVENKSVVVPGHMISASVIEQQGPHTDRTIYTRRRDPMGPHMDSGFIYEAVHDAAVVTAASLKDPALNRRVAEIVPDNAFFSFLPGSSEFGTHHIGPLRETLLLRPPNLFACNEREYEAYSGEHVLNGDGTVDHYAASHAIVRTLNRVGFQYMLITFGKDGSYVATNGDIIHAPAPDVPDDEIVDKTGAGDGFTATFRRQVFRGVEPAQALADAGQATDSILRHKGAQTNLLPIFRARQAQALT